MAVSLNIFLVYPVMESFCKPEGRWKFVKPQKSIWLWNLSWGATEVKRFSNQKWHNDLFCIYLMLIAKLKREKGGDGLTRKKGHWSEITWGSCSSVGCILTTYQTAIKTLHISGWSGKLKLKEYTFSGTQVAKRQNICLLTKARSSQC